jgi:retinol dehydrogenase 12
LLEHDAKVYLAARSKDKAEAAVSKLKEETGKTAIFLNLDLASIQKVKAAAEEFKRCGIHRSLSNAPTNLVVHSKESELHILFNSG